MSRNLTALCMPTSAVRVPLENPIHSGSAHWLHECCHRSPTDFLYHSHRGTGDPVSTREYPLSTREYTLGHLRVPYLYHGVECTPESSPRADPRVPCSTRKNSEPIRAIHAYPVPYNTTIMTCRASQRTDCSACEPHTHTRSARVPVRY